MAKQLKPALFVLVALFMIATNTKSFCAKTEKIQSLDTTSGWVPKDGFWEQKLKVGEITFIKNSKDGKYFYTFSSDNFIRKWETITGKLLKELYLDYHPISYFDFDTESNKFIFTITPTSDDENKLKAFIVDFDERDSLLVVNPGTNYGRDYYTQEILNNFVAYNSKLDFFITCFHVDWDGGGVWERFSKSNFWDSKTGKFLKEKELFVGYAPMILKISNNGNFLGEYSYRDYGESESHGGDGWSYSCAGITDISTNIHYTVSWNPSPIVNEISFSPNEKYFVTLAGNRIKLWDVNVIKQYENYPDFNIANDFELNILKLIKSNADFYDFDFLEESFLLTSYMNGDIGIELWHIPSSTICGRFNISAKNKLEISVLQDSSGAIVGGNEGILCFLNLDFVKALLKPIFLSNKSKAQVGDTLRFYDLSIGNITSRKWNFGDGNISYEKNPRHTYSNAGTYTISLVITDSIKVDSLIKEDYVVIENPSSVYWKSEFEYSTIIPNPNTGSGTIKFSTEEQGFVEIKLLSLTGVEQAVLENNFYVSGYHEIPFNLNNFSQGIYFYTISLNNKFLDSGKLIIVE